MAFIQTKDKWEAYKAFINTWLKDPDNWREAKGVIDAIKDQKSTMKHSTGKTDGGAIRWGLTIPVGLLRALEKYEEDNGNKFFTMENDRVKSKKDMHEFMRKFPAFCKPDRI